jgi:hypothetical protein
MTAENTIDVALIINSEFDALVFHGESDGPSLSIAESEDRSIGADLKNILKINKNYEYNVAQ